MKPLEVNEVTKVYDGLVKAVDNMSFSMDEGEIFGLLGPNGSGKTTLISMVTSLQQPTNGEIKVFGNLVGPMNQQPKFDFGLVPQEIVSHGFFTVEEVLGFISGYYGIKNNKEHIHYLLENLALVEHKNKRVAQLSGGMKRRLLIAKALVHKPKLLLLDEPTAGVDIELRNSLWKFVRELNKDGCSILLTTHYLEEAENLCDRVGIINHGKLLRIGRTSQMISDLTNREFVIELNDNITNISSPYLVEQQEAKLIFRVPATMDFGELLSEVKLEVKYIKDFHVREGNLEDAFLRVLGDQK